MNILHISAECYPIAKVGGLGDVVGALPKYQNIAGHQSAVIVPLHRSAFLQTQEWDIVHTGQFLMDRQTLQFSIIKERKNILGFELYSVNISGLLDRENIYGYEDDSFRFIAFQLAVVNWINTWMYHPDIIHVHDHHAALIPFFIKYCPEFHEISKIKTVLTIHNAQYQGWMEMYFSIFFPKWDEWKTGLIEWHHQINSLACGIRCADKITTVSPSYLKEILHTANGLETLIQSELYKCKGILNGIDFETWNPETDNHLYKKYKINNVKAGKYLNKEFICRAFNMNVNLPLFIFIGRLVYEKAADIIPQALDQFYENNGCKFNFLLLGSGDQKIEELCKVLKNKWPNNFHSIIQYNEQLSHQMYAGADFMLMPSRIEPCGLNQMYALRYGTVPIVRRTGGLSDTVIDIGDGGIGICFDQPTTEDIIQSINRALNLYQNQESLFQTSKSMMTINNSWEKSTIEYIELYKSTIK
jgi:starch synthase